MRAASEPLDPIKHRLSAVARRLAQMPSVPEVIALRLRAGECCRRVDAWGDAPSDAERETMDRRVGSLEAAADALARSSSGG